MIPQHRSTPRGGEREETARDRERDAEREKTTKTEKSRKARKRERRERKRRGVRQIHRNSKEVRDGERREMVEETEGEMGRDKHRGQD